MKKYFTINPDEGITSCLDATNWITAQDNNQLDDEIVELTEKDLKFLAKQFRYKLIKE